MPILYALLAALTGLSLGGALDARGVGRPAVAITAAVVRPAATAATMAARTAAALRPAPAAPQSVAVRRFGLAPLPLVTTPARRRE